MAHAAHAHEDHEAPHEAEEPAGGTRGWPVALILMIATTAVTLWALLAPRLQVAPPAPAAPAPAAAAPDAGRLGPMVERALPGGARITVPSAGVEGRLLAFIQDATRPVDKTTWFDFDRLTFDTASATLRESSHDQLAAVAAILASFPAVKLKLGGYTDNVGAAASNLLLSEQRAAAVRADLLRLGVSAERLSAEGYGEQFPVGDNATPEGRAMNRRISMRVTEK